MNRSSGDISGALFQRYRGNPLLSPNRWPYTVNAVMNAGAAEVDGGTVLLCRVEDRRGISHLTVARSADGVSNWVVERQPAAGARAGHGPRVLGGGGLRGSPGSTSSTAG